MDWKKYEPTLHRLLGFFAEAIPGGMLLVYWFRELRRLPPENDRYPVVWLDPESHATRCYTGSITHPTYPYMDEYWSKARTMDLLNDTKEYLQGAALGWLLPVLIGIGIQRWIL